MIKQMEEQRHNQGIDLIVDFIMSTVFATTEFVNFFYEIVDDFVCDLGAHSKTRIDWIEGAFNQLLRFAGYKSGRIEIDRLVQSRFTRRRRTDPRH